MHKALLNVLELEFFIEPNGPILIKSGTEEGVDPALPNMNFVRGVNPTPEWKGAETIYLPGSSLKGVIRSHAERIIRTVLGEDLCCDPLGDQACGDKEIFKTAAQRRLEARLTGADIYNNICLACRTFGHTVMASRFMVADAYPIYDPESGVTLDDVMSLPIRQMVAIDRRSGGSVNTFTMEVATQGKFQGRITMRNFERWQVGLIALVLRDLGLGRIGIGFGKSRGLGQVNVTYSRLKVNYPGRVPGDYPGRIYGVGDLHQAFDMPDMHHYDFAADPGVSQDFEPVVSAVDLWGQAEIALTDAQSITAAMQAMAAAWGRYAKNRMSA